jgi:tetratricopeptide (TPR) repeat protein
MQKHLPVALVVAFFMPFFATVAPALAQQSKTGFALLIGNAAYPDAETPLKEPPVDARALGDELRRRGFEVEVGENFGKEAMQSSLERLYAKISADATVVVFFSGYGIQSNRQTYMIPVNAQIWSEPDVRRDGFSLDTILSELNRKGARVKIAILDASRRNPYERRFRSHSAGLAAIAAPPASVVMSSASPGVVIDDGNPGMFMAELLKAMRVVNAKVEQIFNQTRLGVSRASGGRQVPSFSSSLDQDVAMEPASTSIASTNPTTPNNSTTITPNNSPAPEAAARADYMAAIKLGTRQGWEDVLRKYPGSTYAPMARDQLDRLTAALNPPPGSGATSGGTTTPGTTTLGGTIPSSTVADQAIRDLDQRIAAAPNDANPRYKRGQLYAQKGDYARARDDFNEVIRLAPQDPEALNNRCWTRTMLDDLEGALRDCNQALKIKPDLVDALDSRGLVQLKLGLFTDALVDYDAALRLRPRLASALYGRGVARLRRGSTDGGNKDIAAAKAINPSIADEFANYGIR